MATALAWSASGLIAGMLIANATIVGTLLSFFVPSLAIYQIAIEIWAGQKRVTTEREPLNQAVSAGLRNALPGPVSDTKRNQAREGARDIQDGILRTGLDASRVPEWFYRHYRARDVLDFADTTKGHRSASPDRQRCRPGRDRIPMWTGPTDCGRSTW